MFAAVCGTVYCRCVCPGVRCERGEDPMHERGAWAEARFVVAKTKQEDEEGLLLIRNAKDPRSSLSACYGTTSEHM